MTLTAWLALGTCSLLAVHWAVTFATLRRYRPVRGILDLVPDDAAVDIPQHPHHPLQVRAERGVPSGQGPRWGSAERGAGEARVGSPARDTGAERRARMVSAAWRRAVLR